MIDEARSPIEYAERLARYINDPSTIRARTLNQFGSAPSIEKCRELRAAASVTNIIPIEKRGVRPFKCGHDRSDDNCLLLESGNVVCRICDDDRSARVERQVREAQARAAELEVQLTALREANRRAEELRKQIDDESAPRRTFVSTKDIIRLAANVAGITVAEMMGPGRSTKFVQARFAVYLVSQERGLSTPEIGRRVGGRDHSSVLHGIARAKDMEKRDPEFARIMARLRGYAGVK